MSQIGIIDTAFNSNATGPSTGESIEAFKVENNANTLNLISSLKKDKTTTEVNTWGFDGANSIEVISANGLKSMSITNPSGYALAATASAGFNAEGTFKTFTKNIDLLVFDEDVTITINAGTTTLSTVKNSIKVNSLDLVVSELKEVQKAINNKSLKDLRIISGTDTLANTIEIEKVIPLTLNASSATEGTPFYRKASDQSVYNLLGEFTAFKEQPVYETSVKKFRLLWNVSFQNYVDGTPVGTMPKDEFVERYLVTKNGKLYSIRYTFHERELATNGTNQEDFISRQITDNLTIPPFKDVRKFFVVNASNNEWKETIVQQRNSEGTVRYVNDYTGDITNNSFYALTFPFISVDVKDTAQDAYLSTQDPLEIKVKTALDFQLVVESGTVELLKGSNAVSEGKINEGGTFSRRFSQESSEAIIKDYYKIQPEANAVFSATVLRPKSILDTNATTQFNKFYFNPNDLNTVADANGKINKVNLPEAYGNVVFVENKGIVSCVTDVSYNNILGIKKDATTAGLAEFELNIPARSYNSDVVEVSAFKVDFNPVNYSADALLTGFKNNGHSLFIDSANDKIGWRQSQTTALTDPTYTTLIDLADLDLTTLEATGAKPVIVKSRRFLQAGQTTSFTYQLWIYNENNPNGKKLGEKVVPKSISGSSSAGFSALVEAQTQYYAVVDRLEEEDRLLTEAKAKLNL